MARNVEITFTINHKGEVEYTICGIKGKGCEELTKIFKNLGEKISEKNTMEYYQKEIESIINVRST